MPSWRVEHESGDVGAFHSRDLTDDEVATLEKPYVPHAPAGF